MLPAWCTACGQPNPSGPGPEHPAASSTLCPACAGRHAALLAGLCPELAGILALEVAAGNRVGEVSTGWPEPSSLVVGLALPFRAEPSALPAGVVYRDVNDTHWWKAEYHHGASGHLMICPFPKDPF